MNKKALLLSIIIISTLDMMCQTPTFLGLSLNEKYLPFCDKLTTTCTFKEDEGLCRYYDGKVSGIVCTIFAAQSEKSDMLGSCGFVGRNLEISVLEQLKNNYSKKYGQPYELYSKNGFNSVECKYLFRGLAHYYLYKYYTTKIIVMVLYYKDDPRRKDSSKDNYGVICVKYEVNGYQNSQDNIHLNLNDI